QVRDVAQRLDDEASSLKAELVHAAVVDGEVARCFQGDPEQSPQKHAEYTTVGHDAQGGHVLGVGKLVQRSEAALQHFAARFAAFDAVVGRAPLPAFVLLQILPLQGRNGLALQAPQVVLR